MRISALLTALVAPLLASALHVRFQVPASPQIPNPATLPPSTTATLTTLGSLYTAPLSASNTFDFRGLSPGSYLLDVHCPTHVFLPMRVDVSSEDVEVWGTFRGNEWDNKGELFPANIVKGTKVVDVKVLGPKNYYFERSGFSPLSILKNPMILIAGFSMLLIFGMPYLMDNMDPEMRAEFEERQKSSPLSGVLAGQQPGQNPLQNFDPAAWLAGSGNSKKDDVPAVGAGNAKESGVSR